jgi:hypothetical protein
VRFRRELSSTLTQRSARVEDDPSFEDLMSLVVRFAPESLTSDQYDHVVRRLNEENVSPADGLDYEVCFGSGDKMKVSLVWDSKEQFDAFAARLMPILAEVGLDPGARVLGIVT